MSDFATEYTRVKNNIISAYTQAGLKGANIPSVQDSASLAETIASIQGGSSIPDGFPDIKQILVNSPNYGGGKYIQLIAASEDTTFLTGGNAYITSDGNEYQTVSYSHTWDTTKDIPCSLGFSVRWVITYTNEISPITMFKNTIWTVLDLILSSVSGIASSYLLRYFEFLPGRSITSSLSKVSNMFRYCYSLEKVVWDMSDTIIKDTNNMFGNCYSLKEVPKSMDFSNVTSAGTTFSICYSLNSLPLTSNILDLSKSGSVTGFFQSCFSLIKIPEIVDVTSATITTGMFTNVSNLNSFKLRGLRATCDISLISTFTTEDLLYTINNLQTVSGQVLTLGSNLAKLSESEKSIAINKGWTLQ